MWNGKLKAVTFSYDDGVKQDIRFIQMLNKYGLKATFNINSELLGISRQIIRDNTRINHYKVNPDKAPAVYNGHEVAVHTLTHPNLKSLQEDDEVIRQVEQDRLNLEELFGTSVVGMAYPCGGDCFDERVKALIKNNTGVKYSRTTNSTGSFALPTDLLELDPTVYHLNFDSLFKLGEEFVALKPDTPALFYIWGHTYEFDIDDTWDKMEEFLSFISGREDIFYGTNTQVLLG